MFHAQQAVEKAMKAFLAWHDVSFRKTHDLVEVGRQCVDVDPSLEELCRRAERLTVFAWIFRYPGDATEPPENEAREALALAREVHGAILAPSHGVTAVSDSRRAEKARAVLGALAA